MSKDDRDSLLWYIVSAASLIVAYLLIVAGIQRWLPTTSDDIIRQRIDRIEERQQQMLIDHEQMEADLVILKKRGQS